ncbi:hypothetical protein CUJ83_05900 [Methanocella sp. CWC-04]|uniref:Uncharacterized protein n=1 Tax=Methanooceanicella nereidis TaxID=2052831 RepID=A0AAP2RBY5_9EURY|nr:hypothetical protein [Methanocella sp. CWC-04]MCD1294533.1 hypothetical protein [Methanocella sp. CWC-04]
MMKKIAIGILLIAIALSVTGCCCCCGDGGYYDDYYYSTVQNGECASCDGCDGENGNCVSQQNNAACGC